MGDFDGIRLKDNHSLFVHFEVDKSKQKCPQVIPVCITEDVVIPLGNHRL